MDDLTRIKGIGPATAKKLKAAGIENFAALAAAAPEDLATLDLPGAEAQEMAAWIVRAGELVEGANDDKAGQAIVTSELSSRAVTEAEVAANAPPSTDDLIEAGGAASQKQQAELKAYIAEARDEARADHPYLTAAADAWRAEHGNEPPAGLRIAAKRDGFRRAGMRHPKAPVEHDAAGFTPGQLDALFAEPNLVVEFV